MGMIQNAANSVISGTAYLLNKGGGAEKAPSPKVNKAEIIHNAYKANAKKGWETRRKNLEAKARNSLADKSQAKANGIKAAVRTKKGG